MTANRAAFYERMDRMHRERRDADLDAALRFLRGPRHVATHLATRRPVYELMPHQIGRAKD
jgi:hypothetical protein